MIRTSYMATHAREHLDRALEAFAKVGREMGVIWARPVVSYTPARCMKSGAGG